MTLIAGPALGPIRLGRRAPLDPFAGQLYEACGLARLLSAWGGAVARVRRLSDNAEMDIGFSGQWPDMGPGSAFATWLGSASAVFVTWYDQTGNGHHAVQATPSLAPRAALNGVLDVGPNGRPVAVLDGVDDYFDVQASAGFTTGQSAVTMAGIVAYATTASGQTLISTRSAANNNRATMTTQNGYPSLAGRRLDADAYTALVGTTLFGAGTWRRQIGRLRPGAAQADITIDSAVTTGAWLGPGPFAATAQPGNVTIGGSPVLAGYATARLSVSLLAQSALDIAALDAALSQIMP